MAGYIGTKAVNLSTTGADIAGDADVSGALDVGGAFTSQGIDDNATSTAMTLDGSGNVGIGTSSVTYGAANRTVLQVEGSSNALVNITDGTNGFYLHQKGGTSGVDLINTANGYMRFATNNSEAMRISSGNEVYVGHTGGTAPWAMSGSQYGINLMGSGGFIGAARANAEPLLLNRTSSDGPILNLRKNGSTVGVIGVVAGDNIYMGSTASGHTGIGFGSNEWTPMSPAGTNSDNVVDLGNIVRRFDDIYATNGTIQTSDRNEKQDIAELSDAEQRVAVAAKGLMRKFRWRDAVAEKGDEARTHFGIIAQDLQAAFAAEGLNAGDYAMFISTTWWETQTEVSAVEAVAEVLDEEGNVVTEAVEAVDAYTRTDTYDTQEEAPEGATERTRLGVRYSELLAFIIGAL